ncbi:MAG: hypothetical protein K2X66_12145, partial [Cyanobacteria bacterium]|nr:hypothetical protein [Cyanobacteriota bacterium]
MSNQYAQGAFGNNTLGIIKRPEASSATETVDNSPNLSFHHTRQSEFDSCAIVAVRDLFSFYGLHNEALQLEMPMRKMLSNILESGLQGVDVDKMNRAFSTFPPQSQGTFRIEEVLKNAHQTKSLKGLVNPQKKVFSTPSVLLFLSECGLEPKTVVLAEPAGRFAALTALNIGQPIFICEDEAKPL